MNRSSAADDSREMDALIAEHVMGWAKTRVCSHCQRMNCSCSHDYDRVPAYASPLYLHVTLPRWSTDLNSCFDAQAICIERFGWNAYQDALVRDMGWLDEFDHTDLWGFTQMLTVATAEQRCRAMLKAAQAKSTMIAP